MQPSVGSNAARVAGEPIKDVSGEDEPKEEPAGDALRRHPTYRPDIDGLRALAILFVLVFHAFPSLLPGGFVGVDIFFVISGFLISSLIFKALQRGDFSFSIFYANRIKRIFPALLLVVICNCLFGWFFFFPGEYAQLGKHTLGAVGYAENFVLWREAGYFDTRSSFKPLMHLWSLGIEEQFYLTYPLLLWLVWRFRRNLLAILIPSIIISFSLSIREVQRDAVAAFFLPHTRFWELWIGGALAYLESIKLGVRFPLSRNRTGLVAHFSEVSLNRLRSVTAKNVLSVVGLGFIGLALPLVHENAFPGFWALMPVCGAIFIIWSGPNAWINRKILSQATMVFVGLISYPLYLWHWSILSFGRILHGGELPWGVRTLIVAMSFALSWATWRFVESPIRLGRHVWIKVTVLALISVVVGASGYAIHRHDGFQGRLRSIPEDFDLEHPEQYATPECRQTVGSNEMAYCRSPRVDAPDVLLIGDSHAGSLYRGLAPAYQQHSEMLMNLGESGCVPFYDTESYALDRRQERDCRPIVNRMLEFAVSSRSVRTIILSVRGPMNMSGHDFIPDPKSPPEVIAWSGAPTGASQADVFAGAFRNTVSRLYATGKQIILFVDWPELGFDPRSCSPRPVILFSSPRPVCGIPRSQVDFRNQAYREIIFAMKREFTGLKVFDPLPYLCDSTICYAKISGHLIYRDDNHLSSAGAIYLSEKFMEERTLGP